MIDGCGRKIDYIRISITDRCNLRCRYCMPADGVEMTKHEELLSFDEIERVCRILTGLGFRKIKLTGGEPLVRRGVEDLVKNLKALDGIESVTLTTNGVLLPQKIDALANAGIDSINISLDTLNPEVFQNITRMDALEQVKAGIEAAIQYPQIVTKINCVPFSLPNQNIWEVAEYARNHKVHVRYIEMMPIGLGREFDCMKEDEIKKMLEEHYGKVRPYEKAMPLGNGPCVYYEIDGFQGKIGFISAMSHKFCGECNRIRMTSRGFLKTCLQFDLGGDLKPLLRGGASDERVEEQIRAVIMNKPMEHQFDQVRIDRKEERIMSQIGG